MYTIHVFIFYAQGERPVIKIESESLECACIHNAVYPILNGFLCDFLPHFFFICKDRVIWLRAFNILTIKFSIILYIT